MLKEKLTDTCPWLRSNRDKSKNLWADWVSLDIYSILYAHMLIIVSGMNELYDNWDYESLKTIK